MCGIFGYVGKGEDAGRLVLEGLKKLEYRGYDSWGIACLKGRRLEVKKEVGKIGKVAVRFSKSSLGFGQTRWATHGGVTRTNAHPHFDCSGRVAVVHNGIVENYQELKKKFKKSHKIVSQTDTEIIAHLIEEEIESGKSFTEAVRRAFLRLKGLNAVVALNAQSHELAAVKSGSPLVVGLGQSENFVASDSLGIKDRADKVVFLSDGELAILDENRVQLFDAQSGRKKDLKVTPLNWEIKEEGLGRYRHYLIKEIYEQPRVVTRIIKEKGGEAAYLADLIKKSYGTYLVGCGTASYAALAGVYFFSTAAGHHLNFSLGSEFSYAEDFINDRSLVIGISQSGETADIIESLNKAKKKGAKIASLVNVPGSTLYRLSDFPILIGAGQERAVLSTKAFTAQLSILLYTAYVLAGRGADGQKLLNKARRSLQYVLNKESQRKIKKLARVIKDREHLYVIGRGVSYPAALEAALKIKEDSYIHAEGFAAGELKHGVIALIEKGTPCLVLAPHDETFGAALASAMEIKARGGYIIGLSPQDNEIFDYFIKVPDANLASIIPNTAVAQTLAYYLTLLKGYDPDKPRNLAKSVTVK